MGSNDRLDTPDFEIRRYRPADLDGVLRSWEAASRLAHPFLSEDFIASERKAIPELYLPNTITDVAVVDGTVAGFIAMMGNEVGAIFLDPALHGKGIGKALMDEAAVSHPVLELEVFDKNKVGRAFYNRYGFVELLRLRHEATGEALIRLRWTRP